MSEVKGGALSNPSPIASPTASGIAPIASGIASSVVVAGGRNPQVVAGGRNPQIAHKYERIILQNKCSREEECSICLDSLYMKQIAYMPCKHSFHQKCIQYSFEKKLYSCPLCRYDLLTALKKTNFSFPIVYDPYTYDPYTYDPYTYDPYTYDPYTYDPYIIYDNDDDGMPPLIDSDEEYNLYHWSNIMVNIIQAIPLAVGSDALVVGSDALVVGSDALADPVEPDITFNDFLIFYNLPE